MLNGPIPLLAAKTLPRLIIGERDIQVGRLVFAKLGSGHHPAMNVESVAGWASEKNI
jgi:hypothetical protein